MTPFITRLTSSGGASFGFGVGSGGKVETILPGPDITSPSDGATKVDFTPTFTSEAAANVIPAGTTHSSSDWQVASDSSFSTIVRSTTNDTTNKTSFSITDTRNGLTAGNTYYVRVRYKDSNGVLTPYGNATSFSTYTQLGTADTPVVSGGGSATLSTPASTERVKVMVYGKNGNPGVPGTPNTPNGGSGGYSRATFDDSGSVTYKVQGVSGGNQTNGAGGQGILFGTNTNLTSSRPSIYLAGGGGGGGGNNTGNQNARGGNGGGTNGGNGTNISEDTAEGGQGGTQNAGGGGGLGGGSSASGFNGANAGGTGGGGGGGWYGGGSGGPSGHGSLGGGGGSGRNNVPTPLNPSNTVNTGSLPTDATWQSAYDVDHLTMTAGTVRIMYYG
jgi:hypothetical protein